MSRKVRLGLELKGKEAKKLEKYLNEPKTITPFMKDCINDAAKY